MVNAQRVKAGKLCIEIRRMPDIKANSLIPEEYLTDSLSPVWQNRFQKAVNYLVMTVDRIPAPSWNEVAEHAAISPFHFHRMFKVIFNETPGRYLRRMRMKMVIFALINEPGKAITEIAVECGFSSSQSLAKALRRDIGFSAKTIKAIAQTEDWEAIEQLLIKLGQPEKNAGYIVEQEMARQLEFHILAFPEQYLSVKTFNPLSDKWLEKLEAAVAKGYVYLMIKTSEIEKPASNQTQLIGRVVSDPMRSNMMIPEGRFLTCRVRLSSLAGYAAAWDALYEHLLKQELEPDPDGFATEIYHQTDFWEMGEADITFCLPLKKSP